jgi:tRNA pseudouridine55 synthase
MDGVLVIDKPAGLTSHDVVSVARRLLKERRIGHTGTLDPMATGVLPLACGQATRLARFLSASNKDYDATILFGVTTDTYDATGTELSRSERQPDRRALDRAVLALCGDYDQMPPAYSAKKVGGRRAYEMARDDEPVVLKAVPVSVTRAEILSFTGDRARIALTSSAGFYVRSFAHRLGELVGTGACLEELRRTRSGDFSLESAVTLEAVHDDPEMATAWMVPLEGLLLSLPSVSLTDEGRLRVSHGREIDLIHMRPGALDNLPGPPPWVRFLDEDGHLVALGQPGATPGSLHPTVVLI